MTHRNTVTILLLLSGLFILSFTSTESTLKSNEQLRARHREKVIHRSVQKQVLRFQHYVRDSFLVAARQRPLDQQRLRHCFLQSRLLLKQFEWATAYFTRDLTNRLNGPPVIEIENADLLDPTLARGADPMGLQVIEELIYPKIDTSRIDVLTHEISILAHNTQFLIDYYADHGFTDWRILDAAKLEVFRIITLGITGFDAPLSQNSLTETKTALQSLMHVLSYYVRHKKSAPLLKQLEAAIGFVDQSTDFDSFDRAAFITKYANPISRSVAGLEAALPGKRIHYNRLLNQNVSTLFDEGAFNVNAFTPGSKYELTPARAALGKRLFFDKNLSGTKTRSCASCHVPALDYTDGLITPTDLLDSGKHLSRNVPTLLNAAFQSNYFYDMRSLTLEDQVVDVLTNPHEMDGSMDSVLHYLNQNPDYKKRFASAFAAQQWGHSITPAQLTNSLASFVRSLSRLNSRFDQYMRGQQNALNAQEIRGFNLFMGKAKCATCHFMPLFNGITPPKYIQSETEVIGVPKSLTDSTLDPDLGYYRIIGVDSYQHAFKIPTVRNISKTGPYMHNGVYKTLEEVMEFYNQAGAVGLDISLPNQTLPMDPLELSEDEKAAIIAFMKSLDSN